MIVTYSFVVHWFDIVFYVILLAILVGIFLLARSLIRWGRRNTR